ncbi:MAG: type II secretion system F family protein, partial [bacterium]
VIGLWMGGVAGGAVAGLAVFGRGPLALACALGGPPLVDRLLVRWQGRRGLRLDRQLPEALELQASALRAGHSLVGSLRTLALELHPPLAAEIGRAAAEIDLGGPVDQALGGLSERIGSRDAGLWVTAMLVHRQTGGNLAALIDGLAGRVRERFRMRAELQALTAQGRLSGAIVALAPLAFFAFLSVASRDQMRVVFGRPVGMAVLVVGLAMELAGFAWIRSILRVRA